MSLLTYIFTAALVATMAYGAWRLLGGRRSVYPGDRVIDSNALFSVRKQLKGETE